MKKQVTVQMTLEWTFDQRDWSSEKKHIKELKDIPEVVFNKDIFNSMYMLNEIDRPQLKRLKVNAN